ncbi:MAG: AtpZ/AtpI family protein [Deltaproteobacteria bacterium]|nr:AtpZ/AtpI family protein [Deltaproteobacteria bacterium]MBW2366156.1 AtpZ/AtpI family protein [Deltaproteobacteria bacterium]
MTDQKKRPFSFKQSGEWMENLSIVMRFGLTMALSIGVFFYIGLRLDRWLGTKGIFTIFLTVFGVVGGARTVYRQVMDITLKNKDNNTD